MTSAEFTNALVERINLELDLPFVTEEQEAALIRFAVSRVAPLIPKSVTQFILDATDGLATEEIGRLEDVLVGVLNQFIDIP